MDSNDRAWQDRATSEILPLSIRVVKTGCKFAARWPNVSKLMSEIKVPSNVEIGAYCHRQSFTTTGDKRLIQGVINDDIIATATLMHSEERLCNNLTQLRRCHQFAQSVSRILAFALPPAA